jgi:hypothetical protein
MQTPLTDDAAITFRSDLYSSLARGADVETALVLARQRLRMQSSYDLDSFAPALFIAEGA